MSEIFVQYFFELKVRLIEILKKTLIGLLKNVIVYHGKQNFSMTSLTFDLLNQRHLTRILLFFFFLIEIETVQTFVGSIHKHQDDPD